MPPVSLQGRHFVTITIFNVALRLCLRTLASLASLQTLVVFLPSAVLNDRNFAHFWDPKKRPFLTPFLPLKSHHFLCIMKINSLHHFIINFIHQLTSLHHYIINFLSHVKIVILGSFLDPQKTPLF